MRYINRYLIPVLIVLSMCAGSCSGRKNKAERKNIIPEKDFISILADSYLADGLLTNPGVNFIFSKGDTLSAYIDIIENYGYTKQQMDRTVRYYFIKNPKKFIKVYDKILGRLSEMESRLDKELQGSKNMGINIWPGNSFYSYPAPASEDSMWFDFPVSYSRFYNLKFTLTIFPDDQSVNPHLGLFLSNTDTAGIEKRNYLSTLPYIKDGQPHTYNIRLIPNLPPPVRLKGWFINQEEMAPYKEKHFRVEDIILSYSVII